MNKNLIVSIHSENSAVDSGGAIFFSIIPDTSVDQLPTNNDFSFINATFDSNYAFNAGAIYVDSLTFMTPKFGPSCSFTNNTAYQYGGAIAFGYYATPVSFI